MNHNNVSNPQQPIFPSFAIVNPSVNETTDQFSSSNPLPTERSNPKIQIHEVTPGNANFGKEKCLKKPQQDFQNLQPGLFYPYNGYNDMQIPDDRGYYSDPQPSFNVTSSDIDGYRSDSQLLNSPLELEVVLSQLLQLPQLHMPITSPLSRSYDSEYISDSQMTDGYSSDSQIFSLSTSPQPQYYTSNDSFGNTTNFAHGSQPLLVPRKNKKNVTDACLNCKTSHSRCETKRPCGRCSDKGIPCDPTQNKKRGRKPRSATSTPEPTSPISPLSPSPQSTMQQRPF
ncbi:16441_t:CDS:2 [Cetraspora pellucida]|uniref:16441_t:CDS:1 n=1 Tax=Cetraspora pellucida TaxID=1433469 RepID=A0A9N9B317_9GLOM|nr:16441_t:CDS:2 [Cetraspora pellucida]